MRGVLIGVAAAASIALAGSAMGQSSTRASSEVPQIITVGSGEARITPDRATIFIGLQTRAATAVAAGADNARRQRAVLDTLRALGLTSEQLSTINYNVSPDMEYSPNGQKPPKLVGYIVTNTVRADVRRLSDVGTVIDASLAKGANEVSSLSFYSSKADSVRRAAMTEAVKNARADADALAAAAGGRVGSVIEISTSGQAPMPIVQRMSAARMDAKTTPIEAGEQTYTESVTVRWSFVMGR